MLSVTLQQKSLGEKSMNKKIVFLCAILSGVLCFLPGCAVHDRKSHESSMEQARDLVVSGKAECVLIRNGKIVYQQKGRGVSPLLALYKKQKSAMKDGVVVDKIIGRAAAAIAICGKVRHVHGEVMSEDAIEYLKEHKITSSSTLTVKRILNRKRNGLCPLEQSVQGINDPQKALRALEQKIRFMQKRSVKTFSGRRK